MVLRFSFVFSILALLSSFALAGTRPSVEDFEKDVVVGMEKPEVIEALGSPRVSKRWKGKDRWIYIFYKEEGKVVRSYSKELHFREGVVVYKGDPIKPTGENLTAEEQDQKNLEQVLADNAAFEKRQLDAKKARQEYENWAHKGIIPDDDKEATVPQFKDVD